MLEKIKLSGKTKLEDLNDKDIVNVSVGSIRKINKLIDVVDVLITENNIHERQIDKLQMVVKELQKDKKNKKETKDKTYNADTIIQTALICRIIEDILDSYMEFVDIVQHNAKLPGVPEQYQRSINVLCERRKKDWGPILEDIKERRKNYV